MIVSINSRLRLWGSLLALTLLFPIVATGLWFFLALVFSSIATWIILLGVNVLVGIFLFITLQTKTSENAVARAEERARLEAEEQFELLYRRSPVPYLSIDRAGIITLSNLAAVRLYETTTNVLVGESFTQHIIGNEEESIDMILAKLNTGVSIKDYEVQIETATGVVKWVLLSVFVYERKSERLVAMMDITHQKSVDKAKSEFVALAAHQLRTPITAVKFNVDLLKSTNQDSHTEKEDLYFTKIERNVSRMVSLINDFLSVSKLETGTFASDVEQINLNEFFDTVIEEHKGMCVDKNLTILRHYEPEQYLLNADTRLLHIVVNNLFSNAVKYVHQEAMIDIGYHVVGDAITITVKDTGIGIPPGALEKLFTKFYRAPNAESYKSEGTGLGLYIVKKSVELMGGTITVESEENVGTTFTAVISVAKAANH